MISLLVGSPHVRPIGRTCGGPNEIELTPFGVEWNSSHPGRARQRGRGAGPEKRVGRQKSEQAARSSVRGGCLCVVWKVHARVRVATRVLPQRGAEARFAAAHAHLPAHAHNQPRRAPQPIGATAQANVAGSMISSMAGHGARAPVPPGRPKAYLGAAQPEHPGGVGAARTAPAAHRPGSRHGVVESDGNRAERRDAAGG